MRRVLCVRVGHGSVAAVACLSAALSAGCASRAPAPAAELEPTKAIQDFAFTFEQEPTPVGVFSEYRITPGDMLDVLFQIKTWKEDQSFALAVDHTISVKFPKNSELNQEQRVRPDGKISLPYLGELYVVGMTVEELTAQLKQQYAAVLKDPELYVVVPEFRSAIKELKQDLHTAPRGLSRLVTVRPDGYATFAMVGDVFVAGKTVPAVNAILNEKYKAVLPGLTVDLFLERQEGSLVYVLGEVSRPGPYPILKPMPLLDAMAVAGSHTKSARLSSVVVLRRRGDKMVATKVDVKAQLDPDEDEPFLYLQPDDIVYVPKTRIRKAGDVMRDIADIFLFNGWSIGVSYELQNRRTSTRATSTSVSVSTEVPGGTRTESQTTQTTTSRDDSEM